MLKSNSVLYYGKKLLLLLLSVWLLSVAVFCISRLAPGDPLISYYGERAEKMSAAEKAAAREKLGLDSPLQVQYLRWLKRALRGDFGISYKYKQPVTAVIADRIGNTVLLGGVGFLLLFFGALALGTFCAWHEDRWPDRLLCRLGTLLSCIPEFWLSLVLILVFAVGLHWLPSSGVYDVGQEYNLGNRLLHLLLPLAVVLLEHLWYYAYLVRSLLLEELRADYVLLARAVGQRPRRILFRHCLRNVLPPYLGLMAVSVPHILGGTYIVETVFRYSGLGALAYESAQYHDYNLLMVLCLMSGATVIVCSLLSDVLSERIDPRIRAAGAYRMEGGREL